MKYNQKHIFISKFVTLFIVLGMLYSMNVIVSNTQENKTEKELEYILSSMVESLNKKASTPKDDDNFSKTPVINTDEFSNVDTSTFSNSKQKVGLTIFYCQWRLDLA